MKQYPDYGEPNTIHDYMNFIQGLNSEAAIVNILTSQTDSSSTDYQKDIDFSGISAHPDFLEQDMVFELKSTNKFKPLILSDVTTKGYIKQVVLYMILLDIEKGRIVVRYNLPYFPEFIRFDDDGERLYKLKFHKDTGQFPFTIIKVNIPIEAPIREKVKKGLLEVMKPLYKEGDITKFPRLDGSLDGSNWKCSSYCKVRDLCMELEDNQTDPNIRDILLNKHIENSVDSKRIYGKRKDRNIDIS